MKRKRILSLLLILAMSLSLMPITAMADPPAAAPNQYLSDITFENRVRGNYTLEVPLYKVTEGQSGERDFEEIEFDPGVTEYDVILIDGPAGVPPALNYDTGITATVTRGSADVENLIGQFTKADSENSTINGNGKIFGDDPLTFQTFPFYANVKIADDPYSIRFWAGFKDVNGKFTDEADCYTFNFYRRATLKSFAVAYESGDTILSLTVDNTTSNPPTAVQFDPYETGFAVEVAAGTEKLKITAAAQTQTDTKLKFDSGSGSFVAGPTDTTFDLDLTKYTPEPDGSLVIPFKLDYAGAGCGVDGYYTLTVKFAEAEQKKPIITAAATAEVDVADLSEWTPAYSATGADDTDATSDVVLSYYQKDGSTSLADMDAVASYIGDAKTNDTFVVKLSLTGADDVTMTVTVNPAKETPGGNDLNGFVKNITFAASDGYVIFDDFQQDVTHYEIELPNYFFKSRSFSVTVDPARDPTTLRHSDLLIGNGFNRYKSSMGFYGGAYNIGGVSGSISNGMGGGSFYYLFDYLKMGENYTLTINVHEVGKEEEGDEYVFEITYTPVISSLTASAGDNSLLISPQSTVSSGTAAYDRDYYTATNADEITLKGTLQGELRGGGSNTTYKFGTVDETAIVSSDRPSSKFFLGGEDKTASFLAGELTIALSGCEKDEDGAYLIPFSVVNGEGDTETQNEFRLHVRSVEATDWTITKQPQSGMYNKGDVAELSVETSASETDAKYLTFQWYSARAGAFPLGKITGANEATFTAPTEIGGTNNGSRDYQCVITDTRTGAVQTSVKATVTVRLGQVNAPIILHQPGLYSFGKTILEYTPFKTEYKQNEAIGLIETLLGFTEGVWTNSPDDPVKEEIEWFYYNAKDSVEDAISLGAGSSGGIASIEYDDVGNIIGVHVKNCAAPEGLEVGEYYFFYVATVISTADGTNRASVTSDSVKLTIVERGEIPGFEGKGTESDPYLLKTVEHFEIIRECVLSGDFLSGAVFKFVNDIELPLEWNPIGEIVTGSEGGPGSGLLPFSGIIDGDGHTLTVATGGKPLLEFARDAYVKNLNIYGEDIDGSGLLNNGAVDYGTDGIYQMLTDPDIITMENVTLKSGSRTRASGLAYGGFISGINNYFFINCTIEEDVIVGNNYDQLTGHKGFPAGEVIGSLVGFFNGRVENCVSYATVYGVRSVGGLVGRKAQSMGDCEIFNSAFMGEIEATGGRVGGIIGSGYIASSAPNTPPVSVRNCYVVADITGNSAPYIDGTGYDLGSGIGGILGSEIGLLGARNNAYISDNYYYGTITDLNPDPSTSYVRVGGILGELGAYDVKLSYENNYYLQNDNYSGGAYVGRPYTVGKDGFKGMFIPKTAEEFADGTVTALLNEGVLKNWVQRAEDAEKDSLYPVHSSKPFVAEIKLSGDYKTTYYIGEALNLNGIVITARLSNGVTETLALSDLEITGYDNSQRAVCLLTLKYGVASAEITVTVLQMETPGGKNEITVYFTLMGDDAHYDVSEGGTAHGLSMGGLKTWIPETRYTMNINATAEDVFRLALGNAGIGFEGNSENAYNTLYVSGVQIPGTNDYLQEFTNGPNSGWMFTVEGKHGNLGLAQQFLNDGDHIIFHYTDDWTLEEDVKDWIDPGNNDSSKEEEPKETTIVKDVEVPATVDDTGKATSEVKSEDVKNALDEVKKSMEENPDSKGELKITAKPEAGASTVDVKFSADAANAVADAGVQLTIDTGVSTVSFDAEALKAATDGANGASEIILTTELVSGDTLTDEQKELVGDSPVFDLTLTVDGNNITDFGSGTVTVTLPYTPKDGEDTSNLTIYYLRDDGTIVEMKGAKYDPESGGIVFTTNHFSKFFVGIASAWANPFTDVKDGDWFYGAVKYAYENGLMNGTAANFFAPESPMTRAMLVTVLYRYEGEPAVTAENPFSDVLEGQWYTNAIIWASTNGIVEGYGSSPDGQLFGPNNNVTREQIATILYRYAEKKGLNIGKTTDLSSYTDAALISSWAQSAMVWANAEGLITGRTATTLAPQETAKRSEVATVLMRYIEDFIN